MIKTYGVFHKVEFVITLIIGNQSVPVDFEGGSFSARGRIPATYTTNNPVIQKAIESTPEYNLGIIKVTGRIPEQSDVEFAKKMKEAKENAENAGGETDAPNPKDSEGNDAEGGDAPEADNVPAQEADAGEQKTEVQVTCMEDAVEYLKANFEGYTSSKLRSKAAVEHAAEEHNITFVGL